MSLQWLVLLFPGFFASTSPPHFSSAGNRELLGEMEGIDVLLQQLSVRLSTRSLRSALSPTHTHPPPLASCLTPSPLPLSSTGVQTSQPVHGRGTGDDGEPLRCLVLLPHAASQSGALPQGGGAPADEPDAQVRMRWRLRDTWQKQRRRFWGRSSAGVGLIASGAVQLSARGKCVLPVACLMNT